MSEPKKAKLKSPRGAKISVTSESGPAVKLDSPKLSTMKGTSSKETLYVDVDDEITAIIDKLTTAKGTIIALVLPKRATVLQSVVNMKLLKRTAETAGKNLVLVTSEASLLPLAGMVGLHVAETPSSRPVIPPAPDQPSEEPESVEEPLDISDNSGTPENEPEGDFDPDAASATPVGVLAGAAGVAGAAAVAAGANEPDEEVVLDDVAEAADGVTSKPDVTPVKKNKKLKVPNFDKFRLRIVLGVLGLVALIALWIVATKVLPSATITIQTDSEAIKTNLNLTLDTTAKAVDADSGIVPAVAQATQKTYTQQVPASGEQNNGDKATGTVTFTATQCAPNISQKPDPIPAGSSVTSNGHTYITQIKATYTFDSFTSGSCALYSTDEVAITALKPGSAYNLGSNAKFTGAGIGTGTATGGTDNIVKVVSQGDIDSAKAKINAQDTGPVKQDLQSGLKAKGLMPVPSTFVTGDQKVTTSASAGTAADSVTVTAVVPYTMLGIKQSDLQTLVTANVNDQIDKDKQVITDDGTKAAIFTQQTAATATSAVVNVKVVSVAGPELKPEELKQQAAGKKAGDIKELIGGLPGVTDVQVKFSPFWVSTAPTNTDKITIVIVKPTSNE